MGINDIGLTVDWRASQGAGDTDFNVAVNTDAAGNVYATGRTAPDDDGNGAFGPIEQGLYETYVVSYDTSGALRWSDQIGNGRRVDARDIAVSDDGDVYVLARAQLERVDGASTQYLGPTIFNGTGAQDLVLIKYNSDGERQWAEQFGSEDADDAVAVTLADNGDILVLGTTRGRLADAGVEGETPDFGVWRFVDDDSGEGPGLAWVRAIGGEPGSNNNAAVETSDTAEAIAVDPFTGNIIVHGSTDGSYARVAINGDDVQESPDHAGAGPRVNVVLDADGNLVRTRQFEIPDEDGNQIAADASSILPDGEGGFVLVGEVAGESTAFIRAFDADGSVAGGLEPRFPSVNNSGSQRFLDVEKGPGDTFLVLGFDETTPKDVWLGLYDSEFNLLDGVSNPLTQAGIDGTADPIPTGQANDLAVRDGKIYLAGTSHDTTVIDGAGKDDGFVIQLNYEVNAQVDGIRFDYTSEAGRFEAVDALYLGYYNRPADPAGQAFWRGRLESGLADGESGDTILAGLATEFAPQAETRSEYELFDTVFGEGEPTRNDYETFVTSVYENLFNRSAEQAGLQFWADELSAGRPVGQAILGIIQGAGPGDDVTVYNKLAVGDFYTRALDQAGPDAFDRPAAVQVVGGVGENPQTVLTGKGDIGDIV